MAEITPNSLSPSIGPIASSPNADAAFSEISLEYNALDDGGRNSGAHQQQPPPQQNLQNLLPIVASTVFSSFSNIISGITTNDPAPNPAPPAPVVTQQHQHQQPAQFYAPPAIAQQAPFQPPPPPTRAPQSPPQSYPNYQYAGAPVADVQQQPPAQFFQPPPPPSAGTPQPFIPAPSGPPTVATGASLPPPSSTPSNAAAAAAVLPPLAAVTGANTYRLTAKRKIYAPLPGLNTTHVPLHPGTASEPPAIDQQQLHPNQYPYAAPTPPQATATPPPPSSSSAFSLSSLINKVPLLDKFQQLAVSPAAAPAVQAQSYASPPTYHFDQFGTSTQAAPTTGFHNPPAQSYGAAYDPSVYQGQVAAQVAINSPSLPVQATPPPHPQQFFTPPTIVNAAFNPPPVQATPPPLQPPPPQRKTSTTSVQSADTQQHHFHPFQQQPAQSTYASNPLADIQRKTSTPSVGYFQPPTAAATPPLAAHQPPPPTAAIGVAAYLPPPPPAGGSGYRLRGKPLYKSPNTYGTVAAAQHFQPPTPIATTAPGVGHQLYDPLQSGGVPTAHSYVTAQAQQQQPQQQQQQRPAVVQPAVQPTPIPANAGVDVADVSQTLAQPPPPATPVTAAPIATIPTPVVQPTPPPQAQQIAPIPTGVEPQIGFFNPSTSAVVRPPPPSIPTHPITVAPVEPQIGFFNPSTVAQPPPQSQTPQSIPSIPIEPQIGKFFSPSSAVQQPDQVVAPPRPSVFDPSVGQTGAAAVPTTELFQPTPKNIPDASQIFNPSAFFQSAAAPQPASIFNPSAVEPQPEQPATIQPANPVAFFNPSAVEQKPISFFAPSAIQEPSRLPAEETGSQVIAGPTPGEPAQLESNEEVVPVQNAEPTSFFTAPPSAASSLLNPVDFFNVATQQQQQRQPSIFEPAVESAPIPDEAAVNPTPTESPAPAAPSVPSSLLQPVDFFNVATQQQRQQQPSIFVPAVESASIPNEAAVPSVPASLLNPVDFFNAAPQQQQHQPAIFVPTVESTPIPNETAQGPTAPNFFNPAATPNPVDFFAPAPAALLHPIPTGSPAPIQPSVAESIQQRPISQTVAPNPVDFFASAPAPAPVAPSAVDFFGYNPAQHHQQPQQQSFNPFQPIAQQAHFGADPADLAAPEAARRESSSLFDNYIALEQQTRSSFIQTDEEDGEVTSTPNLDLPDLVTAPTTASTASVDENLNLTAAPVAASTPAQTPAPAPVSQLFQAVPQASSNTFACFFDTPAVASNGGGATTNNNNNATNWFNPIPAPQSEQAAWSTPSTQSTNTPVHKPHPTDPSSFFNPSAAAAAVVQPAPAPALDIVNNSLIANFFNNPPPLPDDSQQQQLDLVKDCNRSYQEGVHLQLQNGGGAGDTRTDPAPQQFLPQLQQPHRRLAEVAQHFGAGSEFSAAAAAGGPLDTQSINSSNVVEPASSFQSLEDRSEYGGGGGGASSVAGSRSQLGPVRTPAGEEDAEVQRLLEPPSVSVAQHFPADTAAEYAEDDDDDLDGIIMSASSSTAPAASTGNIAYRPVQHHWFYNAAGGGSATDAASSAATPATPSNAQSDTAGVGVGGPSTTPPPQSSTPSTSATTVQQKTAWTPFSALDSQRLQAASDAGLSVCTTNGGRFDVSLPRRQREPVYWRAEQADEVRRCSWFYKGASDGRLVPYAEETAALLEQAYREAAEQGRWQRKVALPGGETVVLHGPNVMVQFNKSQTPESWTENATAPVANRPRVVRRGLDEWVIEEGEAEQVDHLMFMVHGIGAACDLKFRTVEQVVEEFRSTAHQLVQSHYRDSIDAGRIGRIEVLPISWHSELHSQESGIDEKLRAITLDSIPKLRGFTNSTLLDILFYTSPVFCQQIIDAVAGSLNRKYALYCQRNPQFGGAVSLAGHSLGSVIVFDLLQNQQRRAAEEEDKDETMALVASGGTGGVTVGQAGTGQQSIMYPQLVFRPRMFFAFGSPIGMFVTVRGIHSLGLDYKLPTCDGFYNIFHPYDPVAYRIEALLNSGLAGRRPVLIPHHKGRKRMHLELRETIQRVGNDIKQKVVETFRSTMNRVYNLSPITLPKSNTASEQPSTSDLQLEVDEVLETERQLALDAAAAAEANASSASSQSGDAECEAAGADADVSVFGRLNAGRRVDYVLQEAPLEFFNEYLFALTAHVCYWESADTTLFIAKEIYASMGVLADHKQPQPATMVVVPPPSDS